VAISFHCDECNSEWPKDKAYAKCPRCQVMCRTAVTASVMTNGEAKQQLNHITFQREYRLRDEKRERLGRPTPEEIGRQEARKLAQAWRDAVNGLIDV